MILKIKTRNKNNDFSIQESIVLFLSVFNSFYLSIVRRITNYEHVDLITSIILLIYIMWIFRHNIHARIILTILLIYTVVIINYLIFQIDGSGSLIVGFLLKYVPLMLVSYSIDFEKYNSFLYKVSVLYISFLYLYVTRSYIGTVTAMTRNIDILGFAYYALPAVQIIIYNFINKKSLLGGLVSFVSILYLILCGTRGPIICIIAFVMLTILVERKSIDGKKIFVAIILIVVALALIVNIRSVALRLLPIFEQRNFSTRILLYFVQDSSSAFSLSGRNTFYNTIWNNILAHPVLGTGIGSDRIILSGAYCHSIFYEILNSYGIFVGATILIWMTSVIISAAIKSTTRVEKYYIAILFSSSIIKLLMSSTYLVEGTLPLLLGLCLSIIDKYKRRQNSLNY